MNRSGENGRRGDRPQTRFCPTCDAPNPSSAAACAKCGRPFAEPLAAGRRWQADPGAPAGADDGGTIIDLYPAPDLSSPTTTPSDPTRPFAPGRFRPAPPDPAQPAAKKAAPVRVEKPALAGQRAGPPGFLLGCLALLIIGAVAALFLWTVIRPSIENRVEAEIASGIKTELEGIDRVPVRRSGQVVVTEEQINRDLARAGDFGPFSDPSVAIDPEEILVSLELYGTTSTFRGGLDIADGRIVVVDPALDGPATRLVDAGAVAAVLEAELADLLARAGLRPTGVRLRDGSVVIATRRAS